MASIRRGRSVAHPPYAQGARSRAGTTCLLLLPLLVVAAALGFAPATTAGPQGSPDELLMPMAVQQAQLLAGDGAADDLFGCSVAVSGDTAVIGARRDDIGTHSDRGSAYVFVRSGNSWTQQAKLTADDGTAVDELGSSVAIDGDTVIVGAHWGGVSGNDYHGAAYVFVRSGTVWTQEAKLLADDGDASDEFGTSVAVSGDTAVVGAWGDDMDGSNPNRGAAYVFVRSGEPATWTQEAKLIPADANANDTVGCSVALEGDTALVGAYGADIGSNTFQGAAYVFVRSGVPPTWTQEAQLVASDGAGNDNLGCAVALSGDLALVGASGADSYQGAAYVFMRSGETPTWAQKSKLVAEDGSAADHFGDSVALLQWGAVIGASWAEVDGRGLQGAAYVFGSSPGTPTSWPQRDKLVSDDGAADDYFGGAVAFSGTAGIIGAWGHDVGGNNTQGAAYVMVRDVDPPVTTASLSPSANAAGWWNGPVTVTLSATDAICAVDETYYRIGDSGDFTPYDPDAKPVVSADGVTNVWYYSVDHGDNEEDPASVAVRIDTGAPTTATLSSVATGWSKTPVTVTLLAGDATSSVARTEYRLQGAAAWSVCGGSFVASEEGSATYEYRSVDVAGNEEAAKSVTVRVDTGKPTTKAFAARAVKGKKVKLGYQVNDALPGCGQAKVTLKIYKGSKLKKSMVASAACPCNAKQTRSWRCTLTRGRYTIKVYATDIAGNAQSKVGSARLTVR